MGGMATGVDTAVIGNLATGLSTRCKRTHEKMARIRVRNPRTLCRPTSSPSLHRNKRIGRVNIHNKRLTQANKICIDGSLLEPVGRNDYIPALEEDSPLCRLGQTMYGLQR